MTLSMFLAACGGGEDTGQSDRDPGEVGDTGSEQVSMEQSVSNPSGAEDETICRVNMESLAMMLLTAKGSRGSLPETLEEFQGISPAYAEMTVDCGGTPYIYVTDGENFTITCPNGHGYITNDQASWTW
jgi:hypothetical protein